MVTPLTVYPAEVANQASHNMLGSFNPQLVQTAFPTQWRFLSSVGYQFNDDRPSAIPVENPGKPFTGDRHTRTGRASDWFGPDDIWETQTYNSGITTPIYGHNPVNQIVPGMPFGNLSSADQFFTGSTSVIGQIANFKGPLSVPVSTAIRPGTNTLLPVFNSLATPSGLHYASGMDWFVRSNQLSVNYNNDLLVNNPITTDVIYPVNQASYLEDDLPQTFLVGSASPTTGMTRPTSTTYARTLAPTSTQSSFQVGNSSATSPLVPFSGTGVPSPTSNVNTGNSSFNVGNTTPITYIQNIQPNQVFTRYYANPYGVAPGWNNLFPVIALMPPGINQYMQTVLTTNFLGTTT